VRPNEELNQPEELHRAEEPLTELEEYLTRALRHVDAPPDFAESILARTEKVERKPAEILRMRPRVRIWAGGVIAASLVAGLLIAGQVHQRRERQRVETAERQFQTALQITNETLEQTRQQLQQAGIETGD
jgi:hypothetical protein